MALAAASADVSGAAGFGVRSRAARSAIRAEGMRFAQRERMLDAAARCAYDEGIARVTVGRVIERAGVSRKTFYDEFENREDCLACALEEAVRAARRHVEPAALASPSWAGATRAGLGALLAFFHQNPDLARLCVVDSLSAGQAALEFRAEVLRELARLVDQARRLARREPAPLTGEGVVGGVLELLHAHLREADGLPLTEMLNPLMAFIVLPYLGGAAAKRELVHPEVPDPGPVRRQPLPHPLDGLNIRLTYRTIRALAAISDSPGVSNVRFSQLVGVIDQGQASKLLARLERLGLIENTGLGQAKGAANEWHLTERGIDLDSHLRRMSIGPG